ncbi:hypothetical protein R1flu_000106 [Riccia fluitans]|uniref:Uncharacterized protein n=1 Tax=Riccia fluitans TaxID=41844 RepID=A0ABD1XZH7_9MARC
MARSEVLGKGDDTKRARALQAYFEGWKANTCPLVVTEGQTNNNAQMFVNEYTEDRQPTGHFLCIRRCNGCHNYEKDCWYQAAGCCRSYGPSVLKRTGDPRDFVQRATDYNAGWCDWDNGCLYVVGRGCLCEKSNEENGCNYVYPMNDKDAYWLKYKVIWSQHSLRMDDRSAQLPEGEVIHQVIDKSM